MTNRVGSTVVLNIEKEMLDQLMAAARKTEHTLAPVFVGLVAGCPIWVYPRDDAPKGSPA